MGVFKLPGITTAQRTGLVLAERELVYDTDLDQVFRGDGVTAGGLLDSGGGAGTNLGYTASTRRLTSSTGTDVTLPLANTTNPGLAPIRSGVATEYLDGTGAYSTPSGGAGTNLSYTAATRVIASDTGSDATLPIVTSGDAGLAPASGGGTANFLRADGTWAAPGGGGATNLAWDAATSTVTSDTGTDATLTVADGTNAGLMTSANFTKLAGIAAGANNYAHPNHSGDVTSVGDGAQTIANNAVTNAKAADMAANSLKGNNTGSVADPVDLTVAQVKTLLAYTPADIGAATAAQANANHTGDATGSTALTLATVNSNVGSFGLAASVAQFTVNAKGLITAAANVAISIASTAISDSTAAGRAMLTAATAAAQTALLDVFGVSTKGLVPSPGGTSNTTDFLRRDGAWAAPAGGGGGVTDGDKGDITVSGSGTVWTVDPLPLISRSDTAASVTPVLTDDNRAIRLTNAAPTFNVPTNASVAFQVGAVIEVRFDSAGTFAWPATVTVNGSAGAGSFAVTAASVLRVWQSGPGNTWTVDVSSAPTAGFDQAMYAAMQGLLTV